MSQSIPTTMKAILHSQATQFLTLTTVPLPVPKEGELLLKVTSTAFTNGELQWPRPPEVIESVPGTDMAGIVVSAPTTSKFKPADKVYMRSTYPRAGSAREYTIGLEKELAYRPKNLTAEEAAAVPVSALTAWQGLFVHAGIPSPLIQQSNDPELRPFRVLVTGASGAAGLWMVQLAKLVGCKVIGTCSGKNAKTVRSMGADETIDYTQTSLLSWAEENEKVDVVMDCVGGKSRDDAWHILRDHGRLFSIVPPDDFNLVWVYKTPKGVSESVVGKLFIMEPNGEQLGHITELIERGRLNPIVDSIYGLEDYRGAFERMQSWRAVGKVVLKISQEED